LFVPQHTNSSQRPFHLRGWNAALQALPLKWKSADSLPRQVRTVLHGLLLRLQTQPHTNPPPHPKLIA
jgi:hypothetical protein